MQAGEFAFQGAGRSVPAAAEHQQPEHRAEHQHHGEQRQPHAQRRHRTEQTFQQVALGLLAVAEHPFLPVEVHVVGPLLQLEQHRQAVEAVEFAAGAVGGVFEGAAQAQLDALRRYRRRRVDLHPALAG